MAWLLTPWFTILLGRRVDRSGHPLGAMLCWHPQGRDDTQRASLFRPVGRKFGFWVAWPSDWQARYFPNEQGMVERVYRRFGLN